MAGKFNISYVFNAKDRFSGAGRKVSGAMRKIGEAAKKIPAKLKKVEASLNKLAVTAQKSFRKISQSTKKFGTALTVGATLPLAFMAKKLVDTASDAEETASKFKTVFKEVGPGAEQAAQKLATGFGLSSLKAKQLLGDTGDLLSGFGFTGKSALDLSTKVQALAVDLASFTNFSGGAEGASAALTKALLGERESVKSLGIAILEEDVKAKVLELTRKGARFESVRQAKAIATLAIATEQSKNAIGDFARTSDSFANRQRILKARIEDVSVSLGNILLPIALKLTNKMVELTKSFSALSPATKKIILILGGVVAVVGPLLLIISALTFAIGTISAPILIAIGVIAALIVGFIALRDNWTEISDTIGGTIEQIIINFTELKTNVLETIDSIIKKIKNFLSGPLNLFKKGASFVGGIVDFVGGKSESSLGTGDNLNAGGGPQTIANELTVTVAAEKGTQAKAIRGTKGGGLRLGTTMEPAT